MFERLLIANRGEIACRIAHTARHLGVTPMAVYTPSDVQAAHVQACPIAVALTGPDERAAYLDGAQIVRLAHAHGAQAIHPGYGFLSENADFAQACADAGIVFVGPSPDAIRAMGLKAEAKARMMAAGVPVVPGYQGSEQDPAFLAHQAGQLGWPLLIKASAGGGGKGMRVVRSAAEFLPALQSCQREAQASFGDATVILERYLERARHVEVQILGDQYGHLIYLGDRDCSVQRRHQKIIEEAPAPDLPATTRQAMGHAAVTAGRAVAYVGAGTVEFILAADGAFYFMEMNTRLQVEHPVTEAITGIDLVAWQLRIAHGAPLHVEQAAIQTQGVAIEARLYAEQPERDFLPAGGTLTHLTWPPAHLFGARNDAAQPVPLRIDSGVRAGDTLGTLFDPMIAKVIAWGEDRAQARTRLRQALSDSVIVGTPTNRAFLTRLLRCPSFIQAQLDTNLIARESATLSGPSEVAPMALAAAVLAHLDPPPPTAKHPDPWDIHDGFGIMPRQLTLLWRCQAQTLTVQVERRAHTLVVQRASATFVLHSWQRDGVLWRAQCADQQLTAKVIVDDARRLHVLLDEGDWVFEPILAGQDRTHQTSDAAALAAPMPGTVIAVHVKAGDAVTAGQVLLVLEAMKMELPVHAPQAGTVAAVYYTAHDTVSEGAILVDFTAPTNPTP